MIGAQWKICNLASMVKKSLDQPLFLRQVFLRLVLRDHPSRACSSKNRPRLRSFRGSFGNNYHEYALSTCVPFVRLTLTYDYYFRSSLDATKILENPLCYSAIQSKNTRKDRLLNIKNCY